jgi:hypothetical protein
MKINDTKFNSVYVYIFEGKIESDKQLKELQRNARKHPVYTM